MQFALHPKQSQVFTSVARQILFGGAAGPGKSHLLRVAAIAWAAGIPGLQIYLFRRRFPDLYRNHMEGPQSFPALLEPWLAAQLVKINYSNHEISFVNGSKILLAHVQHDNDLMKIQGSEIHVALIDELTHFTKDQYAFIRSRVRMAGVKIPSYWMGRFPRIVAASNPGSIGHNWVKALFIDPVPPEEIWTAPPEEGGLSTQFIPARLTDNPNLLADDPEYALRLQGLNNPAQVKAMLEGDWNVVLGGMFDDLWNPRRHVIEPFVIPHSWKIYRAMDWGSSRPFSVGWWAKSDGTQAPNDKHYPRGSVFRISEWYGWDKKPNEGIKMLAVDVGRGIIEREKATAYGDRVRPGPADASMWDAENGVCIADDVARGGARFIPSDKRPGSRKAGAEAMRKYLKASLTHPLEEPGMFIFSHCRQFIRTVPVLPRDEKDPDDVLTSAEDHVYDEARYFLQTPPQEVGKIRLKGV